MVFVQLGFGKMASSSGWPTFLWSMSKAATKRMSLGR